MIAIYARQSAERENSISIEAQIEHCRAVSGGAEERVYADRGYSGSNINRPDFERMMEDIRSGQISAVYCYRLDRISRNILDFANLQEFFKRHNCSFVSSSENFDTASPMGRAMVNIIMVFAQLERETIASRIKDNYFARSMAGAFPGGQVPLGFKLARARVNEKIMTVLEQESSIDIVREIFQKYTAERIALHGIAVGLNERGVRTSTGKLFSANAIRRIVSNPVYVAAMPEIYDYYFSHGYRINNSIEDFDGTRGCLLLGKYIGKNTPTSNDQQILIVSTHSPAIDADTFLSAQHILRENKASKRSGTSMLTWLTGLVKCAECGQCATPKKTVKANGIYTYLTCRGRGRLGTSTCNQSKYHKLEAIEAYVEEKLFEIVDSIDLNVPAQPRQENVEIKQQIIRLQQNIDRLVDAIADGSAASGHIIKKIEALDAQKEELKKRLEPINAVLPSTVANAAGRIKTEWHSSDRKTKNTLARTFIKTVLLSSDSVVIDRTF